jgi:hypothetical protein
MQDSPLAALAKTLDLSELSERDIPSGIEYSRLGHCIFEKIQFASGAAQK